MENTNEYLNEDVVLEEEELETSEDTVDESDSEDEDSVTLSKAELNKLKRKAIAYDHAKTKQEAKPEQKKVINNNNNNNSASIEETVLKAQGLEEDEIDMLKKVSQISSVSLIDAQKDPVFKLWKEKQEAEEKSRKASMGASKGSSSKTQKGFNTPGLSETEFKEMWKQKMGQMPVEEGTVLPADQEVHNRHLHLYRQAVLSKR
jgi:hypothetical protein